MDQIHQEPHAPPRTIYQPPRARVRVLDFEVVVVVVEVEAEAADYPGNTKATDESRSIITPIQCLKFSIIGHYVRK